MGDRAPFMQKTVAATLKVLLTAPVMFSMLFVGAIGIYFMKRVESAMKDQIDTMGSMLDEEEKERYNLIVANTKAGIKLVMPSQEGQLLSFYVAVLVF